MTDQPTQTNHPKRLGRAGFTITCILALGILAGAGWGAFYLLEQPKQTMAKMDAMPGMHMGGMNMSGMSMSGNSDKTAAEQSGVITVEPAMRQNIGIQTTPAKIGPVIQHVRALGTVKYDQTRLYALNIKVDGWVTKLFVNSMGAKVHKGDPLFVLSSPSLYSAKQAFLIARHSAQKHASDGDSMNAQLLKAAKAKLKFLGLNNKQIHALARRDAATRGTTFYSPYSGVVIKKNILQGSHITAGTQVYAIVDLSKVWVIVSVYESQMVQVHAGQTATMMLTYLPGKTFTGKVQYVYPTLDAASHEVKLRLVFNNPKGLLKPGMFAHVTLRDQVAQQATLVPRRAVVDIGNQKLAFVAIGDGHFQPRHVVTGPVTYDGWIAIKKGVKPGEHVVTSGEFLLGSEASVHAVTARMTAGKSGSGKTSPTHNMPNMPGDMPGMNMSGKDMSDMNMGGKGMSGMNMNGGRSGMNMKGKK